MKTLILFSFLITSLPLWALDFPICKREAEVAKMQALASTLTNEEAQAIVNARGENAIRKMNRARERELACPCDNDNPGLQNLLLFIESDFEVIQERLLASVNTNEQTPAARRQRDADADRLHRDTLAACQGREQRLHLQLLQESQLAYKQLPPNDPKLTVMAFNTFGLKGFIRESPDGTTKTFAFAGSQTLLDWNCNLNPFENKCSKQLKLALDRYLPSAVAWVKSGKSIQCTGHSLGGAMAEGFCAAVMREVRQDILGFGDFKKDNRIKVVTFNALGASETFRHAIALSENSRHASAVPVPVGPNSWLNTNTLHYRVKGDPVALFAKTPHLMGTVFEKPATRRVARSLSAERAAIQNTLSAASDAIHDTFSSIFGGRADGAATVAGTEYCEASDDIVRAHDIESCDEIVRQPGNWVESRATQVDVPSSY